MTSAVNYTFSNVIFTVNRSSFYIIFKRCDEVVINFEVVSSGKYSEMTKKIEIITIWS